MNLSSYARDTAEFAPRRILIKLDRGQRDGDVWAVVDSRSGAYYGLVENEQVWGARDWEGLSLSVPISTYVLPDTTPEAWANRLVYRADRRGGLPVPDDPEDTLGLVGDFLYLPTGNSRLFNVYTISGAFLGRVGNDDGPWYAEHRVDTSAEPQWVTIAADLTRDAAASQLPRDSGL